MGGHAGVNCTRALLAAENISVLRSFAHTGVLLAFDYDGTLSPIAPTPESATLPAATKQLLVRVAAEYPLVVISGRALGDISARVAEIGVRHVFGNHGLEWSGGKSRPRAQVHGWTEQLREQLAGQPGIFVEDKTHSLSVHYRLAPDNARALQLILPIVRALPNVRVICGAAAVNLLPKHAANKGVALRRALEETGCAKAIYVGDDDTDEDAFGALKPDTLLSIRIGSSRESRATYHLDSQESIDQLLQTLIDVQLQKTP
jgi:trehalose 6-phosphate phosphatase